MSGHKKASLAKMGNLAVYSGKPERILAWLAAGGKINDIVCPEHGETALHVAATWGDAKIVKTLLDHNANVFALDKYNRTPREAAAERASTATTPFLLLRFDRMARILKDAEEIAVQRSGGIAPVTDSRLEGSPGMYWTSHVEEDRKDMEHAARWTKPPAPTKFEKLVKRIEERAARTEKNQERMVRAHQSLSEQAQAAEEAGDIPLHQALSKRARRADWRAGMLLDSLIPYEIGDPPGDGPFLPPEAPLRRKDFQR